MTARKNGSRRLAPFSTGGPGGLAGQVGNPGEARLLAMTALLLADDLHNAHEEIDRLRQQLAEGGGEAEIPEDLLQRLETVAERMENP